jgi:chaperone modulatory protein CbpM
MTTVKYYEVVLEDIQQAEVVDEQQRYDLNSFAQVCGQSPEWILQRIEYDILPNRVNASDLYFLVDDVARAQKKAYRLQRDFDASFTAVAMMLDLIEELERLRRL